MNSYNILKALKKTNSTATFFFTGHKTEVIETSKRSVETIIMSKLKAGCDIGNHMYDYESAFLMTKEDFNKSVVETDEILKSKYWKNNRRRWFRTASFITYPYMYDIVEQMNYTVVLGNVHSFDSQLRSTKWNLMNLIGRIQTGDIIIVHAIEESVDFIVELIYYLKYKGFEIMSLSNIYDICSAEYQHF